MIGISPKSSSDRSTPRRTFSENLPAPITSQPTSSIRRKTSGVRKSPLPRPLLRTIGYGHPALRSAVSNPAAFTFSRHSRNATGSFPINCGVTLTPDPRSLIPDPGSLSSLSFSGSEPAIAGMNGVTASVNPVSRMMSAKTSRKQRIVTPLSGARIMKSGGSSRVRRSLQ